MRFNRLITHGAVAVGLYVATGAGSPGSDGPPPAPAVRLLRALGGGHRPGPQPQARGAGRGRQSLAKADEAPLRIGTPAPRDRANGSNTFGTRRPSSSRSSRTSANRGLSCAMTHRPSSPCWKRS